MSARWLPALGLALACGATPARPATASRPAPAAPAAQPRPVDPPRRDVRLVAMRNAASPLVTFRVLFEAGSADDPRGREGATYLAARLMAEGGTEELSYEALTRRLFPMAARVSFQVDRDMTAFVAQVHRDHLAAFWPLFRDVVLHPRMAPEDFARVRSQTQAALTLGLRGNDDEELGKQVLQSLVFANHPYAHPEIGTETALGAVTLEDVRAQRERAFCRERAWVGLAGGYPESLADEVRRDMTLLLGACDARPVLPRAERTPGVHVVLVDKPAASATAISVGHALAITRRDADFPAVQFATNYLGLHRQSLGVLYQTIREARGLNYGDYAYAEHFEQAGGSRFPEANIQRRQQHASLWLRPVPPASAHFALRAALRALQRTLDQGIAPEAFDRTRTFLNGYVSLYTQTESTRLGYRLDAAWNGFPPEEVYADRMRGAWAALTPDAVRDAARRHLTAADVWVAIVAPNASALAEAIATNAPSPITYDSPKPDEVTAEDREIAAYRIPVERANVRVVPLAEVFR